MRNYTADHVLADISHTRLNLAWEALYSKMLQLREFDIFIWFAQGASNDVQICPMHKSRQSILHDADAQIETL